jgi:hypothetical protein
VVGPVLHIDGVKTLICWERLVLAQLVEDQCVRSPSRVRA